MGDDENTMGFQHRNESILSRPISGLGTNVSDISNPFFGSSAWDPHFSLSQTQTFAGSSLVSHNDFPNSSYTSVLKNHGMSNSSHFVHYMSESNFANMVPEISSYANGDMANAEYASSHNTNREADIVMAPINDTQLHGEHSIPEEGATSSPIGSRRKRGLDHNPTFSPAKVGLVRTYESHLRSRNFFFILFFELMNGLLLHNLQLEC